MELKLSDAFETKNGEPELELKVQVYNINRGKNEDLKERCPILKEYMIYVEKVREYVKLMPLEEAVERTVRQRFPKYTVARSSDRLLEITQAGVNKAQAIRLLCGARNIPMEQTLAFGDGYNDLEMLRAVGQGVAMGNAPAAVRADADAVTLDNDRDGIAVFLNRNFTVGKAGGLLYNN